MFTRTTLSAIATIANRIFEGDMSPLDRLPELAHFRSFPWLFDLPNEDEIDWFKTLLLFFDGIAVSDHLHETFLGDPILFGPLAELGMFHSDADVITPQQHEQMKY